MTICERCSGTGEVASDTPLGPVTLVCHRRAVCKHEGPPYPAPGTLVPRNETYPSRIVPCVHCGAPLDRGNGPVLDRDTRPRGKRPVTVHVAIEGAGGFKALASALRKRRKRGK